MIKNTAQVSYKVRYVNSSAKRNKINELGGFMAGSIKDWRKSGQVVGEVAGWQLKFIYPSFHTIS